MPVGRTGDRSRNKGSSRVNGLPDIAAVDAACDLFDEYRSEALGS